MNCTRSTAAARLPPLQRSCPCSLVVSFSPAWPERSSHSPRPPCWRSRTIPRAASRCRVTTSSPISPTAGRCAARRGFSHPPMARGGVALRQRRAPSDAFSRDARVLRSPIRRLLRLRRGPGLSRRRRPDRLAHRRWPALPQLRSHRAAHLEPEHSRLFAPGRRELAARAHQQLGRSQPR